MLREWEFPNRTQFIACHCTGVQIVWMIQREDAMVVRVSFCTLQKMAVTFARISFVRCFGVGICSSKQGLGFSFWHFVTSTLVPDLSSMLSGSQYTCSRTTIVRRFIFRSRIILLLTSERICKKDTPKGVFLGYFYFREAWKVITFLLCFNRSCIQGKSFPIKVKFVHSEKEIRGISLIMLHSWLLLCFCKIRYQYNKKFWNIEEGKVSTVISRL